MDYNHDVNSLKQIDSAYNQMDKGKVYPAVRYDQLGTPEKMAVSTSKEIKEWQAIPELDAEIRKITEPDVKKGDLM